jgi:hypothetical protein
MAGRMSDLLTSLGVRVEFLPGGASAGPASVAAPAARRRRLDGFEIALLGVFAALSLWVVVLDLWQVASHGLVWTGTDGFFIVDQMQYLAWIQSASHHLLVANLFVLRDTPSDYFQPAVAISGVIAAMGVAPWLSLLLWKPIAVLGTFLATRAYAYRSLDGQRARRAALLLGLLFGSFSVVNGAFGIVGDMMPTWLSWGYPFGLIAVALIAFALLGYDRARADGRVAWLPGLFGALASLLHPWQGELLILIIVAAEAIRWREHRTLRTLGLALLTLLLTGLPLLYYLILGHVDISWGLARQASKHAFSFWSIALGAAPLAAVAVLGYRGAPREFLELMTRLWPLAAIFIYFLSATELSATPLHAFDGVTIPLAVLAVAGVQRARLPQRIPRGRTVGVVVLALATIPATAFALADAHEYVAPTPGNANFITHDERDALAYLDRNPDPGGVLTQFYLGEVVPARTGRHTFVGDCLWSEPFCMPRSLRADALFRDRLSADQARAFVRQSGARFLLFSCQTDPSALHGELRPLIQSIHHFGCATVYELDRPTAATGPLAELPADAAVRAARRQ